MEITEQTISDKSTWITLTPTPITQTFPFYVTEAGVFYAYRDYSVKRNLHESYMLLYTHSGEGIVSTGNITVSLPQGHAVIINCRVPHEYFSKSESWKFSWIHFNGSGIEALHDILYPDNAVRTVEIKHRLIFENNIESLLKKTQKSDVESTIEMSAQMHELINFIYSSSLEYDEDNRKKESADDIKAVINFIEENYKNPISVDDMVDIIHISKYHFIRRFRRIMGITPYHYLTNHRITVAKTLLRSTNKTVAEIAEKCGFSDTSNFITQFKKQTGQKPLEYRNDFKN